MNVHLCRRRNCLLAIEAYIYDGAEVRILQTAHLAIIIENAFHFNLRKTYIIQRFILFL